MKHNSLFLKFITGEFLAFVKTMDICNNFGTIGFFFETLCNLSIWVLSNETYQLHGIIVTFPKHDKYFFHFWPFTIFFTKFAVAMTSNNMSLKLITVLPFTNYHSKWVKLPSMRRY